MSVLLDALKRAALDKKKGQSSPDEADTRSAVAETSPASKPEVLEPTVPEEPAAEELVIDESLNETVEETLHEPEEFAELLDDEDWNTEALDDLVADADADADIDIGADDPNESGAVESEDTADNHDPDFEARKEQQELQFALMQAEERREQERREREHRQAEIERQEELQRQKEEAARVFEEEARRREKEEAEKQEEKQKLLEQAREQAEEEARRRAESETALTTLVHEGHAINKRQKQRSRFLYAVLVLTAGGAIIAYYLYLLGNQAGMPVPYEQAVQEPAPNVENEAVASSAGRVSTETESFEAETLAEPVVTTNTTTSEFEERETITSSARTFTPIERFDPPPSAGDLTTAFSRRDEQVSATQFSATQDIPDSTVTNERVAQDNVQVAQEVVHVYHKAVPTRLSETVNQAYQAYQSGDLNRADRLYREALRADPRNRDALLGAAAIAQDRGIYDEAVRLYQIRLNDNPADSHARSAMMALSSQSDFVTSDIDRLLEASPEDAHLHFLKGYAHAVNSEWLDAQAAFFDAHHWDQGNPDYAYNLAVSLDHLGQSTAAVRFYRQAIELARDRKGVFSIEQANQRLSQLSEGVSE